MQPMQPMMNIPPPPLRRPQLPGYLKAILVVKALGCLIGVAIAFTAMAVINSKVDPTSLGDDGREAMHSLGKLLTLVMVVELLQLVGVAGTWSFKRWGVYVLAGFSMLDIVLNIRTQNNTALLLGLVTSLIAAGGIAARWKDFE
ncbi:MAG TPA: hypothetical protein VGH28_17155 [Polyangiaceae bacterium]|jgi:hypothetical protein